MVQVFTAIKRGMSAEYAALAEFIDGNGDPLDAADHIVKVKEAADVIREFYMVYNRKVVQKAIKDNGYNVDGR